MQAEAKVCFYLGANSPTGFYSLYDQLLEPEQAETIYICLLYTSDAADD